MTTSDEDLADENDPNVTDANHDGTANLQPLAAIEAYAKANGLVVKSCFHEHQHTVMFMAVRRNEGSDCHACFDETYNDYYELALQRIWALLAPLGPTRFKHVSTSAETESLPSMLVRLSMAFQVADEILFDGAQDRDIIEADAAEVQERLVTIGDEMRELLNSRGVTSSQREPLPGAIPWGARYAGLRSVLEFRASEIGQRLKQRTLEEDSEAERQAQRADEREREARAVQAAGGTLKQQPGEVYNWTGYGNHVAQSGAECGCNQDGPHCERGLLIWNFAISHPIDAESVTE